MNWLRIDAATLGHPKIGRLAKALDCPHEQALGIVVSLWMAVAANRESGLLDGWASEDLGFVCRWSLDPETVVRALVKAGWVDETPEGLAIHEWVEYQGNVEKVRKENALRQKNYREKHGIHFKESVSNALVTRDSNATPLRSDGRDGRTDETDGEEEDGRVTRDMTVTPAAAAAPPPPPHVATLPPEPDTSGVIASFPCTDGTWNATEKLARQLDEFYPELCIDDEIRDALAAVTTDPSRQKSRKDMRSFLTRWLKNSMADRRNGGKHAQT